MKKIRPWAFGLGTLLPLATWGLTDLTVGTSRTAIHAAVPTARRLPLIADSALPNTVPIASSQLDPPDLTRLPDPAALDLVRDAAAAEPVGLVEESRDQLPGPRLETAASDSGDDSGDDSDSGDNPSPELLADSVIPPGRWIDPGLRPVAAALNWVDSTHAAGEPATGPQEPIAGPSAPLPSVGPVGTSRALDGALAEAFSLAERGAFFTARGKLLQVLTTIAQERDRTTGTTDCSKALRQAFAALDEAADFRQVTVTTDQTPTDLSHLIRFHRTPVLAEQDLTNIPPLVAAAHYEQFAQRQLSEAFAGEPLASKALFGLGKLQTVLPLSFGVAPQHSVQRAQTLYSASFQVDGANYLAANELGVLLTRAGQYETALTVLQRAARSRGDRPEIWNNLAKVHLALGQRQAADLAWQEMAAAEQHLAAARGAANETRVVWVPPEKFTGLQSTRGSATIPTSGSPDAARGAGTAAGAGSAMPDLSKTIWR